MTATSTYSTQYEYTTVPGMYVLLNLQQRKYM